MDSQERLAARAAPAVAPDPLGQQEPDVPQDLDEAVGGTAVQPVLRIAGRDLPGDELQAQEFQVVALQPARGFAAERVEDVQQTGVLGPENVIAVRYQYPRRRSAAEQLGQLLRVDLGVIAVAVVEQDMRGVGLGGQ